MSDTPRTEERLNSDAQFHDEVVDADFARNLERELAAARAELERERMRLAACGVVALANTPDSAAQARQMNDEYRSASCDDVARAVDEQMRLRAQLERAMKVVDAAMLYASSGHHDDEVSLGAACEEWEAGR